MAAGRITFGGAHPGETSCSRSGLPEAMLSRGEIRPLRNRIGLELISAMSTQLSARADYSREFAANAAHELKPPMTSLRGAAELLIETDDGSDSERRVRFLQDIQSDAVRMDQLVQRLQL